jgi:Transposase DDE domain group 1
VVVRADAAFAMPALYEALEHRGVRYAIRLPANDVLERHIEDLLTRPRGRPSHAPLVRYRSFEYQAASWDRPRRVIAKIEHHLGELFPRVGFIVTTLTGTNRAVVRFHNQRGTAEQWIKEGQGSDPLDAPLLPPVSGQRGPPPAGSDRLQPRQSAASAGPARRHPELVSHEPPATSLQDRRTAHPACPVLHPAARRKLLDEKPLSADSRAHRAARVAPDVIERPTRGPGTTRKGGAKQRGVPEQGRRTVQTHDRGAADGTGVVRITSVNVPERMNELSDGVIRPFNATTEGPSGSILKSRLKSAGPRYESLTTPTPDRAAAFISQPTCLPPVHDHPGNAVLSQRTVGG